MNHFLSRPQETAAHVFSNNMENGQAELDLFSVEKAPVLRLTSFLLNQSAHRNSYSL